MSCGVTTRDGLRAAERLDKIRGLEKEPRKRKEDAEHLQIILDGIQGFKRGGVTLTRRDILELFSKAPESAGELYPLIIDELNRITQTGLIAGKPKEDQ